MAACHYFFPQIRFSRPLMRASAFSLLLFYLLFGFAPAMIAMPVFAQSEQDSKVQQLLETLKQPVPAYVPPKVDNAVPAHLRDRPAYQVTWLREPYLRFTEAELQRAKAAKIRMTVVANTGLIVLVDIVKSSGLKSVDQNIKEAVLAAKLEPIRGVDRNLTYILEHEMPIKNPL